MTKSAKAETSMQISFRVTPLQVSQLVDLTILYGTQARAFAVMLDTHWRMTADERARFMADLDTESDAPPPDATE